MSGRPRATALYGLCAAYFVSGLGTAMSAVAIPWLALVTTGSAGSTGVVGFSQMAPYVAVQATAGPLVDRIGLRRTFIGGNTIAAVTVCAIPLLHALGMLSLGGLAALVAVAGAVRGAADAATSPLVPATAARDDVPAERAAAIYSAANRTAMLIGMPVAGVLIAATGAATVVLVDGISFAAAVAVVAASIPRSIGQPRPDAATLDARGYGRELAEGLRFVRADRLLLGLAAMILVTNLLDEALLAVLLPVWAHDRIHEPQALGLVGGAMGLGMLVGVLGVAWLGTRLPRWRTYAIGGLIAASPPFFALAAFGAVPPVVAVCVVSGIGGGVMNPIIGAVQWERVPPQLQARVLGATKASAWLGIPFGSLLGGLLAERAGLTAALVACGAAILVATLAPFVFPSWRGLDRAPGDRVPPHTAEPPGDASGVAAAAVSREP